MVITHFVLAGSGVAGATVGKRVDGAPVVIVIVVVVVVVVIVVVAIVIPVTVTGVGLFVPVATGLARVVWISALLARAVLSFSLICSIWSCSSCSSPGWGGATVAGDGATEAAGGGATAAGGGAEVLGRTEEEEDEDEDEEGRESTRLANEAAGPPFSHSPLFGPTLGLASPSPSPLTTPPLVSEAAMRASRRRVLRVSRLK